jgi:transcriptional regulator with PAS, ATPase and Fis domain
MKTVQQLIGSSVAIRELDFELSYAAKSNAKVLITGESGVGKEVVAQLIHHRSQRSRGPLVTINCAGVPETLLGSELFGHVRGSFTDAHRDKVGWLEQAQGGTIFMDEVGEMSLQMQALLLRFLENGEIQRVGSDRKCAVVDVRVIAATNQNLMERIASKEFREDLYYRLNVIHLTIPPLRERAEDIPLLLDHFIRSYSALHRIEVPQVAAAAQSLLNAYRWPGNIRELKNVVERLVVRCQSGLVQESDLPPELLGARSGEANSEVSSSRPAAPLLFDRMTQKGESFWSVIYEPFMSRDLTRDDIRHVVRQGLERTLGNYRALVQLFGMPQDDYKRFLNFLRKYECHIAFQRYRTLPARGDSLPGTRPAASPSERRVS